MTSRTRTPGPRRSRRPVLVGLAVVVVVAVTSLSAAAAGTRANTFEGKLNSIVNGHRFSIIGWELQNLSSSSMWSSAASGVLGLMSGAPVSGQPARGVGDQANIKTQIESAILEAGLGSRSGSLVFPPLNFRLTEPPRLLVVSPRDRISFQHQALLRQDISLTQMAAIEASVDELDVSSLVVELGGFAAAYPTIVSDGAATEYIIETGIHEWLHQYLTFRPLGFRYLLDVIGIEQDQDLITMNETVASMVSQEVTDTIIAKHYPAPGTDSPRASEDVGPGFDEQMREIRKTVDALLAEGKVDEAEAFMERRRGELEAQGRYIRKLNQAYFAFHGIYADSPASTDPIGDDLRELRARSLSLREFIDTVSQITSRKQLAETLDRLRQGR